MLNNCLAQSIVFGVMMYANVNATKDVVNANIGVVTFQEEVTEKETAE